MGAWGKETLWDYFQRNAAENPERTAIVDDPRRAEFTSNKPRRLNYAQALAETETLAGIMHAHGLKAGDIVLVQLPNIVEQVLMLLAAARQGIIISPLLVQFRKKELSDIFDSVKPKAVFTIDRHNTTHLATQLLQTLSTAYDGPVFCWGETPPGAISIEKLIDKVRHDTIDPPPKINANNSYTICWTSGTEGKPKGVVRSHNNWLTTARGISEGGQLQAGDTLLNPFPLVNMASIGGVFATWLWTGGTFVLHNPFHLDTFLDQIESEQVSYSIIAPALLKRIADSHIFKSGKLKSLRALGTGSAPPDGAVIARYETEVGIKITNYFGSNEGVSLISNERDFPDPYVRVQYFPRVGRDEFKWSLTVANWCRTKITAADTGVEITEPGSPGIMRMKGPSLFAGYYHNGKICRNTFDEQGYFITGDLFEIAEEDGVQSRYKFVGRHKDIIIRGGMNIAPAELDTLLMEHPKLMEGAVASYPDPVLGERICACVVPHAGELITLEHIIDYLSEKGLARYKLPERILETTALPRNALAKVQRDKLREIINATQPKNSGSLDR